MFDPLLYKSIVKGIVTYFPGYKQFKDVKTQSTHSSANAYFCYSFWLSMLVVSKENGIELDYESVGEIGNGGSFGIGYCALLCGSQRYYSLDVDKRMDVEQNIKLIKDLVLLFKNRTPISDSFRQMNIPTTNSLFPDDLILLDNYNNENFIKQVIEDTRLKFKNSDLIFEVDSVSKKLNKKCNLIFSRAVMEHVTNPFEVHEWTKKNLKLESGVIIHDIELHTHGIAKSKKSINSLPFWIWKIIFGNRPYFLNRFSLEDHLNAIEKCGFKILMTNLNVNRKNSIEPQGVYIIAKLN